MFRRRSIVAVSRRKSEPTSFGAERIPANTAESRSVPRSPVRSAWKNPGLPRDLSAFSRLYAKSSDCVAERGGFEPQRPFGIRWAKFGPSLAHIRPEEKAPVL